MSLPPRRGERLATPRLSPRGPSNALAELVVVTLLGLAALGAAGFAVVYVVEPETWWLGLSIGLAFCFLGLASAVFANVLSPREKVPEERGELVHPDAEEEVVQLVVEGDDRLTRGRLIRRAAVGAAAAVGGALLFPLASLGPVFGTEHLADTPWRRGRRLVDEFGNPLRADDITTGPLYTAFAEGSEKDSVGSPLAVVRLAPEALDLPPERRNWAPGGIIAFSKICPHAGCAVSIYRRPLYPPKSPGSALICPCHYSTFDPRRGGKLVFGPAGRDLPQLPLEIDSGGYLRAAGDFSGRVGPSWWGVRR